MPTPSQPIRRALPFTLDPSIASGLEVDVEAVTARCLEQLADGDIDDACRSAAKLWGSAVSEKAMDDVLKHVISNARERRHFSDPLRSLMVRAGELGFGDVAYHAGHYFLHDGQTGLDHLAADKLSRRAGASATTASLRAFGLMNAASIARSGVLTGEPDLLTAASLYEMAANMGLVTGMINAGLVNRELFMQGHEDRLPTSMAWFTRAIETVDKGAPSLDSDRSRDELVKLVFEARANLSTFHINGMFPEANLETAIDLLRSPASQGHQRSIDYLATAYSMRLTRLESVPAEHAGANWRQVLQAINWQFEEGMATHNVIAQVMHPNDHAQCAKKLDIPVDAMHVKLANGKLCPVFVANAPGIELDVAIELATGMAARCSRECKTALILFRNTCSAVRNNKVFTPIYVLDDDKIAVGMLNVKSTPDSVIAAVRAGVSFLDEAHADETTVVSVAINMLSEGLVVNSACKGKDLKYAEREVSEGVLVTIPFVNEQHFEEMMSFKFVDTDETENASPRS